MVNFGIPAAEIVSLVWGTPWQPILGLKLLLTSFVRTIVTTQFVMEAGSVVGR